MVSAIQGTLLTCDIQLKEIIKALNEAEQPGDRFIIADLPNGHLFIKSDRLEHVQKKVKEHSNKLHYEVIKDTQ